MASNRMDEFCGSEFWNSNITWYTDDPDIVPCFQQTVLVWTPCAFLWLFAALDIYYIRSSSNRNIPWNVLNLSKLFLTIFLIVASATDLVVVFLWSGNITIYSVDYFTPAIKAATFTLAACLQVFNVKFGIRTSGVMFLFWFFLTIFSIPKTKSEMRWYNERTTDEGKDSWVEYKFATFMASFASSCALVLFNCFGDQPPKEMKFKVSGMECPERTASFISKITYTWFDSLAWKGFRSPLKFDDLYDLGPEVSSKQINQSFAIHWNCVVQKCQIPPLKIQGENAKISKNQKFSNKAASKSKINTPIWIPILKTHCGAIIFASLLKLLADISLFASPQILFLIIKYVQNRLVEPEPVWHGVFYAFLLFIVAFLKTVLLGQYNNRMSSIGLQIRTALMNAIYRKALRISNSAKKESTVGEIVNLMAIDAQRIMELMSNISQVWSSPIQVVIALYFLWQILGPSALAGVAILIIIIIVCIFVANKVMSMHAKEMKFKDERLKLMNEILNGIKVLKLYAWEQSFERQILTIRKKEMNLIKMAAHWFTTATFLWFCAPFMITIASFTTFVLVDETNVLDPTTAFVSLSLFNILNTTLYMLPRAITDIIQANVGVQRIKKFLNSDEINPEDVNHVHKKGYPLEIQNGSFSWGDENISLKNINIKVAVNELVALVGAVGSGKSSVVSAVLGEMDRISGWVNTYGNIAYVSQQAWIQNGTLRENILFGKTYEQSKYDLIIEACALKPDIDILSAGDSTEIGEKGINLSGGQKQRVTLARAVYNDADIYLLDDPLSAVDSHVGKHIFKKVIGPSGLLANKTRILVTHGITFLPNVNKIYVLNDGEVIESGTYQELLNKEGAFADFLVQHRQDVDADEDIDEIKLNLENKLPSSQSLWAIESAKTEQHKENNTDKSELPSNLDKKELLKRRFTEIISIDSDTLQTNATEKDNAQLIKKESSQTRAVKFEVYKHYFKNAGIKISITTVLMNILYEVFSVGSNMWLTKWTNDDNVANDTGLRDIYLGGYGSFGIMQVITHYIASLSLVFGCLYASEGIHLDLLKNVMKWPLELFDTTPIGRILNRFSDDVDALDNVIVTVWRVLIKLVFSAISVIVVISFTTPIFISVIIPIAVLYFFVQRFYIPTSRQLKRLESVSRSPIYSFFSETIAGTEIIRVHKFEDRFINNLNSKIDENFACKYHSIVANLWLSVRLETIGSLIILFAALFAVIEGQINASWVGLSIACALQITNTLYQLVKMASDIETNIVSVERIKEYSGTKQEAPWILNDFTVSNEWPENGSIEFRDFKVRYREGVDLVLKGISFTIQGGEKVGIVGRTGAGKSSLTLSLFRIIEAASGKIYIDGVDISLLGLQTLRSRLTIIPQDPVLFAGSLRINLDPFNSFSDDELWQTLENAHLISFVRGQAAGLEYEISEGGKNVSVGQRQLICLTRALLRKTKILVLDEATAAIDLETDDLIQKTIRSAFKDCTVLTIAHRLNTILDFDKVIVLDNGKVLEHASPTELLQNKNSAFYSMAKDAGIV